MRALLLILSILSSSAAGYFIWLAKIQYKPVTTLVSQSVNITQEAPQSIAFTPDIPRRMSYDIDLILLQAFPRMEMKKILGDNVSGDRGELAVSWRLFLQQKQVAQGDSRKRKLARIYGHNGEWGLTIGNLMLDPNQHYQLELSMHKGQDTWQNASPQIKLNLSQLTSGEIRLLQQRFYLFSGALLLLSLMLLVFRAGIGKPSQ